MRSGVTRPLLPASASAADTRAGRPSGGSLGLGSIFGSMPAAGGQAPGRPVRPGTGRFLSSRAGRLFMVLPFRGPGGRSGRGRGRGPGAVSAWGRGVPAPGAGLVGALGGRDARRRWCVRRALPGRRSVHRQGARRGRVFRVFAITLAAARSSRGAGRSDQGAGVRGADLGGRPGRAHSGGGAAGAGGLGARRLARATRGGGGGGGGEGGEGKGRGGGHRGGGEGGGRRGGGGRERGGGGGERGRRGGHACDQGGEGGLLLSEMGWRCRRQRLKVTLPGWAARTRALAIRAASRLRTWHQGVHWPRGHG